MKRMPWWAVTQWGEVSRMLQAEWGAEEKNLRGTTFGTAEGRDWLGLMEDGGGQRGLRGARGSQEGRPRI